MFVITRGDILGGAQSYVRDLAMRFAGDGHHVLVVTGALGPMTDALTANGIPVQEAPGLLREIHPIRDARAVAEIVKMIRSFAPELVTTHSSKAGVVGRTAAKVMGVPAMFTVHGWSFNPSEPEPKRTIYRLIERASAMPTKQIICVSNNSLALGRAAGIDERKMVTVHNGVPDVDVSLRARPAADGVFRLLSVARFQPPKDHATLLRAVKDVPGVELDMVGDGPALEAAKSMACDLRISDRVKFLGRRSDVAQLLSESQAFALCSKSEGFPFSTLEAMRAGLPVIVSNVGGAPEAVIEGETGFVVQDNTVEGWKRAIAALATDPARRARLGDAGRRRYESEFTFEKMYQRTVAVYRDVARKHVKQDRDAVESVSQPRQVIEQIAGAEVNDLARREA